jgi:hypothetical protein
MKSDIYAILGNFLSESKKVTNIQNNMRRNFEINGIKHLQAKAEIFFEEKPRVKNPLLFLPLEDVIISVHNMYAS